MRIALKMSFELDFVEYAIIKEAELRGQAPKCPNETQLSGDAVGYKTEPRLQYEVERAFGLPLHFIERVTAGEKLTSEIWPEAWQPASEAVQTDCAAAASSGGRKSAFAGNSAFAAITLSSTEVAELARISP